MPEYDFTWVDAFTDTPFAGNPCAVVFAADDVDEDTRIAFTRETRLSECAFLQHSDDADFGVRYYVASGEIPMAGHPTIATTVALVDAGLVEPTDRAGFTLEVGAGVLRIDVEAGRGGPPLVTMRQLRPTFGHTWDAAQVAPLVGLDPRDIADTPQTVSTGTPFLVTQVRSHDALRRAQLDVEALRAFHHVHDTDFFEPFLTAMGGATDEGDVFSRLLLAPPEPPEDPFTGSATGCLGAWLWRHGHIPTPRFVAEQGHDMERPGSALVEVVGPPDDIEAVRVGGRGVVIMRGRVDLPGDDPEPGAGHVPGDVAAPITGVETGVTAFIGETEKNLDIGSEMVTSMAEFTDRFGGKDVEGELPDAVDGFFTNGGRRAIVAPARPEAASHEAARVAVADRDVDLVVLPPPVTGGDVGSGVVAATVTWAEQHGAMVVLDSSASWEDPEAVALGATVDSPAAVLYHPRILVDAGDGTPAMRAPAGAIAGLLARTDRDRGVWRAAAGRAARLRGAVGLAAAAVDDDDLETVTDSGINLLRVVPGSGVVAWGARTTSSDPEWRYIPVRRTALFIEHSVAAGLEWVVHEPNDEGTWVRVRAAVGGFLQDLHEAGAFVGITPDDAWFVHCDRATMTAADQASGRLRVEVGFAPLKPAEFVVVRIELATRTS